MEQDSTYCLIIEKTRLKFGIAMQTLERKKQKIKNYEESHDKRYRTSEEQCSEATWSFLTLLNLFFTTPLYCAIIVVTIPRTRAMTRREASRASKNTLVHLTQKSPSSSISLFI
jgi:hypothetical protein